METSAENDILMQNAPTVSMAQGSETASTGNEVIPEQSSMLTDVKAASPVASEQETSDCKLV